MPAPKQVAYDVFTAEQASRNAAHEARLGAAPGPRSAEEDFFTGFRGPLGGTGAASWTADDQKPYSETYFGIHHSSRGVRMAFQGSVKTALILVLVLMLLISRPGVIDLMLNVVKTVIGGH